MGAITINGSCLCSKVRFAITGTDKGAVLCHCLNCRKAGGSTFMHNTRLANATMEVKAGQDLIKTYDDGDTKSGTHLFRSFCNNCGSSLFLQSAAVPGLYVVQCSAIDDDEPRPPKFELFEEARRSWLSKVTKPKL